MITGLVPRLPDLFNIHMLQYIENVGIGPGNKAIRIATIQIIWGVVHVYSAPSVMLFNCCCVPYYTSGHFKLSQWCPE